MITGKASWLILSCLSASAVAAACSPTPVEIKFSEDLYVLDGADAKGKIVAIVLDAEGNPITEGLEVVFFCESNKVIKLDQQSGDIEAASSGEAVVEAEVVGTELKGAAKVRVKIPASINLSHEKLRLWTGQVKDNVWAEVLSEKGAFIEGFLPEWASEDPSIVKVEPIVDPSRRQSWVKMTGMKSGDTYVITSFRHISESIRVRVYDEDEEVSLAGERLGKAKKEGEEGEQEEKKK